MIVAVCVDDNWGMTFFGKRQSRDRAVIRDVMRSADRVYVQPFSAKLFARTTAVVEDQCLQTAEAGALCFIEHADILPYADRIEKIIVYHWNRDYPYDKTFRLPEGFVLQRSTEFRGNSHETITKEEYAR